MDLPPPASALDPAQIDQTVPGGATGDTDASDATPGGFPGNGWLYTSFQPLLSQRFAGIVHHTDGEREFSYDRDSHMGRLDKALIEAKSNGWIVVDMKKEWKVIYP